MIPIVIPTMIPLLLTLSLTLNPSVTQNPPARTPQLPEVIDRHPITGPEIVKSYEIRELLPLVPQSEESTRSTEASAQETLRVRKPMIDSLTELITREIQPPSDSKEWSLHITPNGTLVLRATPAQHEWMQAFLERNRSKELVVLVESQWIEGPKGAFQRMGIPAGPTATVIEAKDRDRLHAACHDDAQYSELMSPRLVVNPLAIGTIYIGETIAYVKSYKLETVQPGDVKLAVPEIVHVEEGMQLQAKTVLLDSNKLMLDLEAWNTVVRRPISTKSIRLAPDMPSDCTIALPEIDRKSVQARCTLAPDATVAFCLPVAGKDDREFLILLSARSMRASELQKLPEEKVSTGSAPKKDAPPAPEKPR